MTTCATADTLTLYPVNRPLSIKPIKLDEVKSVTHLHNPTIDKVIAHALLDIHRSQNIPVAGFWAVHECDSAVINTWHVRGNYGVDIGYRKYHGQTGSATEFVARELRLPLTKAQQKLIEITNQNNKTGYLKDHPGNVALILRRAPGIEIEGNDPFEKMVQMIESAKDVIKAWVYAQEGGIDESAAWITAKRLFPELTDELDRRTVRYSVPFTIANYLACLVFLETEPARIEESVRSWIEIWNLVQTSRRTASQAVVRAKKDKNLQFFYVDGARGAIVISDDKDIVQEAAKQFPYVIARSPNATVIIARDRDLTPVASFLLKEEPRCWYFLPNKTAILNGGPNYPNIALSKYSAEQLTKILERFETQIHPIKRSK